MLIVQIICFSRKRPLQLHGFLSSVFKYWWGDFRVSVLAKIDAGYEAAYGEVRREFPGVTFLSEGDFRHDLDTLLGIAELTCFGCDDVMYVAPVHVTGRVADVLSNQELLGLSLRLGHNVTQDMFGNGLPQPNINPVSGVWDFTAAVGDWGYPWEVLGTIYRTEFVREMVAAIQPISPSQLEERGSRIWAQHTSLTRMATYPITRLVVPTVNIVQNEFPNGIRGNPKYTPEYLLEQWHAGWRMDVDAYARDGAAVMAYRRVLPAPCGGAGVRFQSYQVAYADQVLDLLRTCGWTDDGLPSPEVLSDAQETGCAFVALREDQVIGFVRAVSDYEVVTYVCELAVLPDARLKGVGRVLLDMVAAEYPAARVDVLSTADAVGFYEAVGYVAKPGYRRWPP